MKNRLNKKLATFACASNSTSDDNLNDSPKENPKTTTTNNLFSGFDQHSLSNLGPDFPELLKSHSMPRRDWTFVHILYEKNWDPLLADQLQSSPPAVKIVSVSSRHKLLSKALLSKTSMGWKTCTVVPHPTYSKSSSLIFIENLPEE